ncbi:unnamed protein product [Brachionus calyciflorus]|uniref:Methionine synthase reductase n=1 Tax=Brachionus calyciflorus TaxID=104777 RepID=A0A813M3M2_9BILA|nr:unnamed protein product [Brachionus calyciflorus]
MSQTEDPKICIIYATQTGQSKTIAETINDEAITNGFEPKLYNIDQFGKDFKLNEITDPLIFVCSTTGDGETPESARKCFSTLKRLDTETNTNYLNNLNYALLGLGDTNYTQFCNGPKLFHKRFQELGAKCFYGPVWADDGTGLEIEVEPFKEGLWDVLDDFFKKQKKDHNKQLVENSDTDKLCEELNKLAIINPSLSNELSVPEFVENHFTIEFLDEKKTQDENGLLKIFSILYPQSSSGIFKAKIIENTKLTRDDAEKDCYDIKFLIDSDKEILTYEPGYAIDVICPNDDTEVTQLLKRLRVDDSKNKIFKLKSKDSSKKLGQTYVKITEENDINLEHFFKYCVDIRWNSLKKNFLRFLSEYCSDESEKNRLLQLSSREASEEYQSLIKENLITLLDLLNIFKSCQPPIEHLIQMLLGLNARSYSLCSSSSKQEMEFVFNLVKFKKDLNRTYEREGLGTGYLKNLKQNDHFYLMKRKFQNFTFPDDSEKPLIMIGPGTGIAPFIGYLREKKDILNNLNLYLFYGCRDPEKDFLFKNEILEDFAPNSKLFSVSFSRFVYDEKDKFVDFIEKHHVKDSKYVQDSIRFHSKEMIQLINEKNGYIYVCGDAKNMSKDVFNCFAECLCKELEMSNEQANKYLMDMIKNKRYKQDIWA